MPKPSDLIIPGGPRIIKDPDGSLRVVGLQGETETRTLDLRKTGSEAGEYKVKPLDVMMAAARMRRDGMTREAIRKELDLLPHVTNAQLDAFLDNSEALLNKRIAAGLEPAESVHRVAVPVVHDPDDEPD